MIKTSITDFKYWKYYNKYDMKSLLGITYKRIFIWIIGGAIISTMTDNIPQQIENIRLIIIGIPVFLTILGLIIITINGGIFLISKLCGLYYEKTQIAQLVDYVFGSIFPHKLYRRFHTWTLFNHHNITIYYGVLFITVLIFIIIIATIISHIPELGDRINNNSLLHNMIKGDKYQYSIPIL